MNPLLPLGLGIGACGLFISLSYYQAYKRKVALERKRRQSAEAKESTCGYAKEGY